MDLASPKVPSWRLSNTMHADFCVDALNETIAKHGLPKITNTVHPHCIQHLKIGKEVMGTTYFDTLG